jgi:hypothetical protein
VFRHGKWRFWFPTLIGLTALNAVMTAVIFGSDTNSAVVLTLPAEDVAMIIPDRLIVKRKKPGSSPGFRV